MLIWNEIREQKGSIHYRGTETVTQPEKASANFAEARAHQGSEILMWDYRYMGGCRSLHCTPFGRAGREAKSKELRACTVATGAVDSSCGRNSYK
jgi:hypothetical protein